MGLRTRSKGRCYVIGALFTSILLLFLPSNSHADDFFKGDREKLLKEVQSQICPLTDGKKPEEKKLEATACPECAVKSPTLESTIKKIDVVAEPIKAERDIEEIRREVAFYKKLGASTDESFESITSWIDAYKGKIKQYPANKAKAEKNLKDVELLNSAVEKTKKDPQAMSSEEKQVLKARLMMRKETQVNGLKYSKDSVDKYKKILETKQGSAGPLSEATLKDYASYLEDYSQRLKKAEERVAEYDKALEILDSENVMPLLGMSLDLGYMQSVESAKQSLKFIDTDLENSKKSLAKYEEKLNALLAKSGTTSSDEKIRAEHKELEKKYEVSIYDTKPGFQRCNLTVAELQALKYYTQSGYNVVNRAMRTGGKEADEVRPISDVLNSALNKLGKFKGQTIRGAELPKEILEQHKVGEIVTYPAFTSASLTRGFGRKHSFVIQSKSGRYVGSYSPSYNEDEVLFAPNTKFKILSREEKDGKIYFVMEEVE